jgi:hypothetical protein
MANRARLGFVAVAMLAGSSFGCGGGGGACGVAPCGGDVVGTWEATVGCVNRRVLEAQLADPACPGMTLGDLTHDPSGTLTFIDASTFSGSLTFSSSVVINIPTSCTGGMTCAEVTAGLQAGVGTEASVSCTGTSTCACTLSGETTISGPGTYTLDGTTMTLTDSTGAAEGGPYCVEGTTLHLLEIDMSMSMGSMGNVVIETDVTMKRP